MTHYSEHPDHVRIDFFKEHGKWGYTEEMYWAGGYSSDVESIFDAFAYSLQRHLRIENSEEYRMHGMWVVCLEPYHSNTHPLMGKVDDYLNYKNKNDKTS